MIFHLLVFEAGVSPNYAAKYASDNVNFPLFAANLLWRVWHHQSVPSRRDPERTSI